MQQAIATGTVIAKRYQIQKKIPDTTSNQCYLAEDTDQSNRLVVISFPRMELQTLPGFTSTFDDACKRLIKARLNGLVKILDHGEHDSQPYAVLQYVTHETLESSLRARKSKQEKLSVDEVLDWARPLAVTLDELHELDYVHSNVRPSTIYLGEKRQVLLGDFITELAIQRLGAFKQAISSLDIADHLAPEYIKSNYNESYDQYLLATIIYEALAGRSHFHNPGSSEAYRRQVATKFPETLLNHRPELVGASKVLGQALERNPAKRFVSCREFVNQLGGAKVNPVFGTGATDKPVTVIKKVLDLDETEIGEPIVTSIRSNRNSGRKKGLVWLGVLLVGTGAAAYAVNHFGGVEQFKAKLTTAWSDLSKETAVIPVIVPVTGTVVAPSVKPAEALVNSSDSDPALASSEAASTGSDAASTNSGVTVQVEAPKSDASPAVDNAPDVSVATVEPAKTSAEPTTSIAVSTDRTEPTLNNRTQSTDVSSFNDGQTEVVSEAPSGIEVDSEALETAISLALSQGQSAFLQSQAKPRPVEEAQSQQAIQEAINSALQDAQLAFMQESSPAEGTQAQVAEGAVGSSANTEGLVSPDVGSVSVDQSAVDNTETNTPLSDAEIAEQDLNARMIEANRIADERAAAARKIAEEKRLAREARSEAVQLARENARKKRAEDAEAARQQQLAEDAAKREAVAAKEAATNSADAAKPAEQPNQVVRAPVKKSLDEMQKERARIQALKTQKIARISSITKDCLTSGKIHRQAIAGNLAYVKNCLSVGVNPDVTQSNNWSLLHLASLGGYLNMAKLLVAKGANVNAKADDGKTPLDMATDKKQERLINYLRSRGGVKTR